MLIVQKPNGQKPATASNVITQVSLSVHMHNPFSESALDTNFVFVFELYNVRCLFSALASVYAKGRPRNLRAICCFTAESESVSETRAVVCMLDGNLSNKKKISTSLLVGMRERDTICYPSQRVQKTARKIHRHRRLYFPAAATSEYSKNLRHPIYTYSGSDERSR